MNMCDAFIGFIFDEPKTEAETWGNYNETGYDHYIGSFRGWEYVSGWDFDHNYDDTDDTGKIGGWAAGNDQFRKYPFKEI